MKNILYTIILSFLFSSAYAYDLNRSNKSNKESGKKKVDTIKCFDSDYNKVVVLETDGSYTGVIHFNNTEFLTDYGVYGLTRKWLWGETERGTYAYQFNLEADMTGLYYDFTHEEKTKASLVLKCTDSWWY